MNLPNFLTLLRIFFVPLLVAVLVQQNEDFVFQDVRFSSPLLALWIFLAAALTDLLDGYLARRWKQITTVGTLLDPIADKLLISAALVSLVQTQHVPAWLAILLIGREFAISGLRTIAAAYGYTIKANDLGKTKMVFQVIAIAMVILGTRFPELTTAANWMMGLVVFFSVASALSYFAKFWSVVDGEVKERTRRELIELERRERLMVRKERKEQRRRKRGAVAGN